MYSFLLYVIKVSLTLAAFYLFYKLLCSRDTFHRSNRVLLLFLLILSSVIPFMYVDLGMDSQEANEVFEELTMTIEPTEDVTSASVAQESVSPNLWQQIPWRAVLVGAYLIGLAVCLVRFASSLLSIVRFVRGSQCQALPDGTILVTHTKDYSPFSWMRYIIVSERDLRDNRDMILAHERAHIRLGHSWDLLFAQLCVTMQWFNPAAWLLKRELEAIHEYEADSDTLRQGFDARQYQLRLFEAAAGVKYSSITNNYTNCSTKKRIIMMMKKQTSPWALLKALYVLPVAFAAVAVISCTSPKENEVEVTDSGVTITTKGEGYPMLVIVLPDGTEISPVGELWAEEYNKDNSGFLKYFNLNAENIESIEIKKGEEAKAAYGEKGANGVILFRIKEKSKTEILNALTKLAKEKDADEPLKVNIKYEGIKEHSINAQQSTLTGDEVFQVVEEQPMFPGGMQELMKYLQKEMKYPKEAQDKGIQGRVIVQFVVNKDGSICEANVVKSVDPLLDAEALRVVNAMPHWTPGKQRGEPVRVRFTIPVAFHLAEATAPKASELKQAATAKTTGSTVDGEEVFLVVENLPEYPGGMQELMKYLQKEMKYPKEAQDKGIQGRVIVQFIVKKDGSIIEPEVVKPVDPLLDAEAVRVVNAMPKWNPGKQRGQAVNVRFTLPVTFRLQ